MLNIKDIKSFKNIKINKIGPILFSILNTSNNFISLNHNNDDNNDKNKLILKEEEEYLNKLKDKGRFQSSIQFKTSRILTRLIFQNLNISTFSLPILNDSFGVPQFPSNVLGSLSHKNNLVLCGIIPLESSLNNSSSIGVDIEQLGRNNLPNRLAERILTGIIFISYIYFLIFF